MRTWGLGGVCTYTTSDPVLHERWDILNSFLVIHLKTALEDGGMRRLFFSSGHFLGREAAVPVVHNPLPCAKVRREPGRRRNIERINV